MANLKNIQNIVKEILMYQEETRGDDFLLIYEVISQYIINGRESIEYVFKHHEKLGIPSFHSITRTRRKLQAKYPELKDKKVSELRASEEKEYREYSRGGIEMTKEKDLLLDLLNEKIDIEKSREMYYDQQYHYHCGRKEALQEILSSYLSRKKENKNDK